jgi:hypothetical protein
MPTEILARKLLNNCRGRALEALMNLEGLRLSLAELQTAMFGVDTLEPDAYLYDDLPTGRNLITTEKRIAYRNGNTNIRPLYQLADLYAAADQSVVNAADDSKGMGEK